MKLLQRSLSVLLVFALLSVAFSVGVSAEDVESKDFEVNIRTSFYNEWLSDTKNFVIYPNNDTIENTTHVYDTGIPEGTTYCYNQQTFVIEYTSDEPILKKGRKSTISLFNAYFSMLLSNSAGLLKYDKSVDGARALLIYTDGTSEYVDDVTIEKPDSNGTHNFILEVTPKKDVAKVEFICENQFKINQTYTVRTKAEIHVGERTSPAFALAVTIQSEEAGLLSSVVQWLQGIKEGITSLFNSIKELPSVLWGYIQNGLQRLFVPTEGFIVQFKDDMDSMLADKLGAVYQVVDITFDSWDRIETYDTKNTIKMPATSINLGNGNKFTFGGDEVPIVPRGMEYLAGMVKVITGIVCTMFFVNGLRKRYDEIMGVNQ